MKKNAMERLAVVEAAFQRETASRRSRAGLEKFYAVLNEVRKNHGLPLLDVGFSVGHPVCPGPLPAPPVTPAVRRMQDALEMARARIASMKETQSSDPRSGNPTLDSITPTADADPRPYPTSPKECVRRIIADTIRIAKSQIEKLADTSLKSPALAELASIESSPAPAQKEFGFQAASQREAEDRHRENLLARQLVIAEREKEEDLRRTRAWLARQPRPFMGGFL